MKNFLVYAIFFSFFNFNFLVAEQQEITVGTIKIKCLVFTPITKDKNLPGLFLYIGPGTSEIGLAQKGFDEAKDFAEKQGLFLVTPISEDKKGFIDDKNEIVIKLAKSLIESGKVLPKNILLGGTSRGGVAALQIAGSGELPLSGVFVVPGLFYTPPQKTNGFKNLHVYLRIGANDELKWATMFDQTSQSLKGWGSIIDGKIVEKAGHVFSVNWDEIGKWKETFNIK